MDYEQEFSILNFGPKNYEEAIFVKQTCTQIFSQLLTEHNLEVINETIIYLNKWLNWLPICTVLFDIEVRRRELEMPTVMYKVEDFNY